MLRAGARTPDAAASTPSTSAAHDAHAHEDDAQHMHHLYATLNEYLLLETKFQPRLCLPNDSENGEVTTGARDGAAHVLRSLKVWFDLPVDVFVDAINLFDRFLTKMKVRPCHVPCITVSCMNIAIEQHAQETGKPRAVSVEELVAVSQSACTAGDVTRMSRVVCDKLSSASQSTRCGSLHWLRLLHALLQNAARHVLPEPLPQLSELEKLLEITLCDAACANARLSELAIVLLFFKLEQQIVEWSSRGEEFSENAYYLFDLGAQLQVYCRMSDASLLATKNRARWVISRYEARCPPSQRQRLVWKLSSRTLKLLRPTDRLTSLLPTIEEQHLSPDATPPRHRSGSESSESEETSDWPRSPLLPVYCDN